MELKELMAQCDADSRRWFPGIAGDPFFIGLAMAGEVGEIANILKKVARGSVTLDEVREHLMEEGVDTLIYLSDFFTALGGDPIEVYNRKRAFNELRFGQGPLSVLLDNQPSTDGSRAA